MSPQLTVLLEGLEGRDWQASPPDWDEIIRLGLEEGWPRDVLLNSVSAPIKTSIRFACGLAIRKTSLGHYATSSKGSPSSVIRSMGWEPVFDIIAERHETAREMDELLAAATTVNVYPIWQLIELGIALGWPSKITCQQTGPKCGTEVECGIAEAIEHIILRCRFPSPLSRVHDDEISVQDEHEQEYTYRQLGKWVKVLEAIEAWHQSHYIELVAPTT